MAATHSRIDSSAVSHLALCLSEGCAWRGRPVRERCKAQSQIEDHRRQAHPDAFHQAASKARARDAAREERGVWPEDWPRYDGPEDDLAAEIYAATVDGRLEVVA